MARKHFNVQDSLQQPQQKTKVTCTCGRNNNKNEDAYRGSMFIILPE